MTSRSDGAMKPTDEIKVIDRRYLPPEPRLVEALGHNRTIESAIADLVDNSIDAGASMVLVRFVRTDDRIVSLYVIDNGSGMDDESIDVAMTLGSQRDYGANDLGHFGVGLKAASLGQANSLTVISRRAGARACGRRWLKSTMSDGFECDVLDPAYCSQVLDGDSLPGGLRAPSGTVVRWDDVSSFPRRGSQNSSTSTSRRRSSPLAFISESLSTDCWRRHRSSSMSRT